MPLYDVERFGIINTGDPKHADVFLVTGGVNVQNLSVVRQIYEQMPEPKYVIAMGNCAISGGPFAGSYAVADGCDWMIPVDVYLPGCPPRPEALLDACLKLRERVLDEKAAKEER